MFAQHSVPASDAPTVLHFYNSTVDMIKEIRTLMYRMLAKRFINTEPALNLIASTNWDIAMLGTSTSPYVDIRSILFLYYFIVACIVAWVVACVVTDIVAILMFFLDSRLRVLLKEYENFRDRMQKEPSYAFAFDSMRFAHSFVGSRSSPPRCKTSYGTIPSSTRWRPSSKVILAPKRYAHTRLCFWGQRSVWQCSPGGRGQMQLDAKVFMSELEKLTTLRPIPHFNFLDKYIKAYYLSENELEHWILTSKVR